MNPTDIVNLLDELGKRLGPTGQHVFQLSVQYQVTSAIVGLVFGLVLTIGALLGVRYVFRHDYDDNSDAGMAQVMSSFIGILVIVIGATFIGCNAVTLMNPEYSALRDVLVSIGGGPR